MKGTPDKGGPPGHPVFRLALSTGPNAVMYPIPQHSFLFAGLRVARLIAEDLLFLVILSCS